MKKIIKTDLYNFFILLEKFEDDCYFEIRAVCKRDKTKSSITNFNFIISELIASYIALESYETTILVDSITGNKIYDEAIQLFNDTDWMKWLYSALEDDRNAGEWS